jgi:hypothetical protein
VGPQLRKEAAHQPLQVRAQGSPFCSLHPELVRVYACVPVVDCSVRPLQSLNAASSHDLSKHYSSHSTLLFARLVRRLGHGVVYAIETSQEGAERAQEMLRAAAAAAAAGGRGADEGLETVVKYIVEKPGGSLQGLR